MLRLVNVKKTLKLRDDRRAIDTRVSLLVAWREVEGCEIELLDLTKEARFSLFVVVLIQQINGVHCLYNPSVIVHQEVNYGSIRSRVKSLSFVTEIPELGCMYASRGPPFHLHDKGVWNLLKVAGLVSFVPVDLFFYLAIVLGVTFHLMLSCPGDTSI